MAGMVHSFALQKIPAKRRRDSNAVGGLLDHRTFVCIDCVLPRA
jgi:hypothetical protein